MTNFLREIFSLKQGEFRLLALSFGFIFLLFCAYALLRPIRDALGLNNKDELKWLFLGTFCACIIASIVLMWLSTRIKRRFYADFVLVFFGLNLLAFYVAMRLIPADSANFVWLCRVFYVWVSIFNLFAFSSAWSLMSDIFSKEASRRLFGIIAAGASLGSVAGASAVKFLVAHIGIAQLIFASMSLLAIALIFKYFMIREISAFESDEELSRFDKSIGAKNPFVGFSLIVRSKYLLALCGFILLLTSVSTFLYMEQARIIRELFPTREARTAAFANIDLIVQLSALFIQLFLTAKIAQIFKLSALLSTLGVIVGLGFVVLIFTHPAFIPLVVVMSIRRVGEYALVKPGREMLFVPLGADEKYKVKSFIDTVIYRGGDAISSQVESILANISITLVLGVGALISFVWSGLGVFLGRNYEKIKPKIE